MVPTVSADLATRRYHPRGAARDVFHRRESEVLLSGPAGTGKSRACLEKLHMMALSNPGMRGLIVRKTAVSLTSTGLVTFREHVAKEAIDAGIVAWYGGSTQEAAQYRYANGSIIAVGGMDKATRVMSSEYDIVYVQEAIELTENDWEAILTRLRNGKVSFQQIIADTNPDVPTHWLNQRAERGQTIRLESKHEDNPMLYSEDGQLTSRGVDYMDKLDALTGVRYQRLRKGLWVAAEGIIYEGFDRSVHIIDRFQVPESWTRWWTVDFGYVHPFVWQCWAEDPDGRLYLEREVFHTKRIVEDHCKQIRRVTKNMPRPTAVITDHDAEGRATLEKHLGVSTVPARKAVTEGIQHVQQRLKVQGDGKPRLFLLRDALVERDKSLDEAKSPCCTAEEFPGYVWDTGNGRKAKETPLKERDDGMDALRYIVAQRDMGSRPGVRFL
jgi:PBSX family phage terminase large subunit